jgi:uncharacterized membrane protein YczE
MVFLRAGGQCPGHGDWIGHWGERWIRSVGYLFLSLCRFTGLDLLGRASDCFDRTCNLSGYIIRKEWPNNRLIGMAFNAALTGLWIDITLLLTPLPGLFAYVQLVIGVLGVAAGINFTRLTMVQTTPLAFQKRLVEEGTSVMMAAFSSTMLQLPPMDFLINAIYEKVRFSYGVVKQGLDAFILVTSIIMSTLLPLDYKLGFGTIIIIVIIGPCINLTYPYLERLVLRPAK